MELVVCSSNSNEHIKQKEHVRVDCCSLHPSTLLDLRVPVLGVVLVQIKDENFSVGVKTFVRSLPCDRVPPGEIRLAPWVLDLLPTPPTKVRVESISANQPLHLVKKLIVAPLEDSTGLYSITNWVRPTHATNSQIIQNRKTTRNWIEKSIKQRIEGQLACVNSFIMARVKAQSFLFRVLDIQVNGCDLATSSSSIGVIMEDTVLEVVPSPISMQSVAVDFKGMDELGRDICKFIVDSFRQEEAYTRLNIPNKKAVIVTGVSGAGKKTLVQACCKSLGLRTFPVSLAQALSDREVLESGLASGLSYMGALFDMALQSAPSAVILQDMDVIAKDRGIDSQLHSSAVSVLCKEIERARQGKNVFVFAISRFRGKLPDIFQKPDFFQHEFQVPVPVRAQRQKMLTTIMTSIKSDETVGNGDIECIASKTSQATSGYIAKDLRNLCRSALLRSLRSPSQSPNVPINDVGQVTRLMASSHISSTEDHNASARADNCTDRIANINLIASPKWEDFLYALNSSKPSQQIEFESLARNQQRTVFAGYHALKRRVYQNIHWPLSSPESFRRIGTKPPMGLLLYGPSGCGKTFLVQTLAAESNFNFIPIKGPEIFSKYLGETEATLRRLFTMARQVAPCILFFDEMDSIGAKRGWGGDGDGDGDNQAGSSNGVNERVLSTLLNEMDGVEERTGVFVVGCTNQPQAMDDALLRPGRLDQLVYIGYPSLQDRFEIINEIGSRIPITKDIDTRQELAKHTVGFSPADLTALFREAAILSLRRNISSTIVEQADIKHVIQRMSPLVQGRVLQNAVDGNDVIVPDLYRKFYQRR